MGAALWKTQPEGLGPGRRWLLWLGRLASALLRDLARGGLNLHAMSLVYTTLLSLVPLLALSFSVLKGFGVHNQLEPLLLNILAPLGDKAAQITQQILAFVSNMKVGVLGAVGLVVLLYTVVSLMQKVVRAIDFAWDNRGRRSFAQRFTDYLAMLLIGPLLLFALFGIVSGAMESSLVHRLAQYPLLGALLQAVQRWMPTAVLMLTLGFLYWFLPNVRVRWWSALAGGVFAGLLWKVIGLLFALFVVNSTRYTAIYSAFATILLFMIWLYLSWLSFLLGARLAYYLQYPEAMRPGWAEAAGARQLVAGLRLLQHIVQRFYAGQPPLALPELARAVGQPAPWLEAVLARLEAAGILIGDGADDPHYLPARAPEQVSLGEVVAVLEGPLAVDGAAAGDAVAAVLERLAAARDEALAGLTLRDLAGAAEGSGSAA